MVPWQGAWEGKDKYDLLFFFFFFNILLCCSVTRFCLTLCDPLDCSMPGFLSFTVFQSLHKLIVHWVGDAIQSSHLLLPASSCLQSFPASGSFLFQLFASGGQNIGTSASVLPVNIQDWSPSSPRDTQEFSSTTVWKHQFLDAQPSLWSISHIHAWLLDKP